MNRIVIFCVIFGEILVIFGKVERLKMIIGVYLPGAPSVFTLADAMGGGRLWHSFVEPWSTVRGPGGGFCKRRLWTGCRGEGVGGLTEGRTALDIWAHASGLCREGGDGGRRRQDGAAGARRCWEAPPRPPCAPPRGSPERPREAFPVAADHTEGTGRERRRGRS